MSPSARVLGVRFVNRWSGVQVPQPAYKIQNIQQPQLDAPYEHFDAHWYAALEAAGIRDFRFHDLRHTVASMFAAQGASLLEIADVLGHKTLAMVKRYSHLVVDHKAKVIKRMVAAKGLRQARSAALLRIWIADSAQRPAGVCPERSLIKVRFGSSSLAGVRQTGVQQTLRPEC